MSDPVDAKVFPVWMTARFLRLSGKAKLISPLITTPVTASMIIIIKIGMIAKKAPEQGDQKRMANCGVVAKTRTQIKLLNKNQSSQWSTLSCFLPVLPFHYFGEQDFGARPKAHRMQCSKQWKLLIDFYNWNKINLPAVLSFLCTFWWIFRTVFWIFMN